LLGDDDGSHGKRISSIYGAAMATSWFDAIMWGREAEFRDDRGRPRLLGALPIRSSGTPEELDAGREARRIIRRRVSAPHLGCLGLVAGYIAFVSLLRLDAGSLVFSAIILGVGLLAGWSAARVNNSRRIARELVGKGFCPQCGYSLSGARVEDDGCVTCPECQGAWRA
jgi:hypothetical protein